MMHNPRIFIFVSRSVPLSVLRSFAADIDTLGNENIRLVFKAFPRNFLNSFLRKDPDCTDDDCVVKAKIIISDRLFQRYAVTQVPAVVFDPDPANSQDDWLLVYGAVPLKEALTLFYEESGQHEFKIAANRVAPQLKYPKLNANILWCLVMLCISLLVGMAIPGHLTITKTRSVKYHLFWEIDRKTATYRGLHTPPSLRTEGRLCTMQHRQTCRLSARRSVGQSRY